MQAAPGSAVNSSLLSLYASPDFGRTLSPEGSALADAPAAEGSAGAPSSPEMSQTFTANPMADLEAQQLDHREYVAGLEASSEPQRTGDAGSTTSSTAMHGIAPDNGPKQPQLAGLFLAGWNSWQNTCCPTGWTAMSAECGACSSKHAVHQQLGVLRHCPIMLHYV